MKSIEVAILKHIGNDEKLGKGFLADDLLAAIAGKEFDVLDITLTSPGGSVVEGQRIGDIFLALRADGKTVNVHTIGPVASIATELMVKASHISASKNSTFMIHKAHLKTEVEGNADQLLEQAQALINLLDETDVAIQNTYRTNRKLKNENLLFDEYYKNEKWMTPQEALSFGLIDSIAAEVKNFYVPAPQVKNLAYESRLQESLGYSRSDMPQVDEEYFHLFISYFEALYGLDVIINQKRQLTELKPAQNEMNREKVISKINTSDWRYRPFIISSDDFLLDGHHDWAAGLETEPLAYVNTWKINIPAKKLIKKANELKITISQPV